MPTSASAPPRAPSSRGAPSTACRLSSSTHTSTAFVACDLRRSKLFDVTLDGCKLVGTVFSECVLRPMTVRGGQWQGVTIRGTNLARLDLSGVDLREADLSMSDLTGASLKGARLDRAILRETTLTQADLRGASLDGVDLALGPAAPDPAGPGRRGAARGAARRRGRRQPLTRRPAGAWAARPSRTSPSPRSKSASRSRRPVAVDGARALGLERGLLLEGVAEDEVQQGPRAHAHQRIGEAGRGEDLLELVGRRLRTEPEDVDRRHQVGAVAVGEHRVAQLVAGLDEQVVPRAVGPGRRPAGQHLVGDRGEQGLLAGEVVVDGARPAVRARNRAGAWSTSEPVVVEHLHGPLDDVLAVVAHWLPPLSGGETALTSFARHPNLNAVQLTTVQVREGFPHATRRAGTDIALIAAFAALIAVCALLPHSRSAAPCRSPSRPSRCCSPAPSSACGAVSWPSCSTSSPVPPGCRSSRAARPASPC